MRALTVVVVLALCALAAADASALDKKRYKLLKPKIVSPMETPEKAADMSAFASVLYHEPSVVAAGAKEAGLTAKIDEELKLSKFDMILLSNSCKGKLKDKQQKSLCEKLKKKKADKKKKNKKKAKKNVPPEKKAKALKQKAKAEKKKGKHEAKKAQKLKQKAKKVAKKAVAKKAKGNKKAAKKLKKKATKLAKKAKKEKKKSKKDLKKAKKDKKKAKKEEDKADAALVEIFGEDH